MVAEWFYKYLIYKKNKTRPGRMRSTSTRSSSNHAQVRAMQTASAGRVLAACDGNALAPVLRFDSNSPLVSGAHYGSCDYGGYAT